MNGLSNGISHEQISFHSYIFISFLCSEAMHCIAEFECQNKVKKRRHFFDDVAIFVWTVEVVCAWAKVRMTCARVEMTRVALAIITTATEMRMTIRSESVCARREADMMLSKDFLKSIYIRRLRGIIA